MAGRVREIERAVQRPFRRTGWRPGLGRFCRSVAVGASLVPAAALSQSVQGTVTDRASGLPVAGMVVHLLDATGAAVAATMSDDSGAFNLRAPAPGTYRLRAEAVGVFSETSPELRLIEAVTMTYAFVFGGRTRDLPAVRIVEKQRCVSAPDAGIAVAALWDEIRKALTATHLTTAAARYRYNLLQYEREIDVKSQLVRRSRSWERTGLNEEPYGSLPAESLATHGYVQVTPQGTWYYAPDARTFLSDAFMRTHCLKPAEPTNERGGLVGLAFEPVEKRDRPDVRGTLWLDARTSELQYLEFAYTGLPRSVSEHFFGGRVEFDRLPSGAWVVERWHIRMPKLARELRYRTSPVLEMGVPPRLTPVSEEVVTAIVERGGEVKDRVPANMEVARSEFASLSGSVYDSTSGGSLTGADIWLEVPGRAVPVGRALTDSAGAFRIDSIQPGDYILSITHARLDTLGASLAPVPLALAAGESLQLEFSIPSPATIGLSMCTQPLPAGAALVRGSVRRDRGGAPVPGARVLARWEGEWRAVAGALTTVLKELSSTTDESGHFTLCGLPRDRPLEVRASDSRSSGEPVSLTLDSAEVTVLELLAPETGTPRTGNSVVVGVVSGADNEPLADAEVRVLPSDTDARTNARGSYRLTGLAAGRHLLEIRALGYEPVRRIVLLQPRATDTVNVWLARAVRTLSPVTTTARRDPYRTGFYARMRNNTGGHFLTPERINASGTRRVTELLAGVPGIQIRQVGQVSIVELTGRGARTAGACPVLFFLDGVRYEPGVHGLDGEMGLDNIEAIEVYDAATAPVQFAGLGAGCGVILLWSREKAVYAKDAKDDAGKPIEVVDPTQSAPRDARKKQ